jgi:hypothetical protein
MTLTPARDLIRAANIIEFARDLGIEPFEKQKQLLTSTALELLTLAGRQFGKSCCLSIICLHHALYYSGPRPANIVIISPSEEQSMGLGKTIMGFHRSLDLPKPIHETKTFMEFENKAKIRCLPSSEATVRGISAVSLLAAEEAGDVPPEMLVATEPMLATVRGARFIAIGSARGAPGHWFREAWLHGGNGYERITAKTSESPLVTKEYLDRQLAKMGPVMFGAEFENIWIQDSESAFSSHLLQGAFTRDFELFRLG